MKKLYVALAIVTVIAGVTVGIIMNKPAKEAVKAEHVTITAQAEETNIKPVTSQEAPQEPVVVNKTSSAPIEEQAPVEPISTSEPQPAHETEQDKINAVVAYINQNTPIYQSNQCITAFYRSKEAFYKNKEAAVGICIEVMNDRTIINKNASILEKLNAL